VALIINKQKSQKVSLQTKGGMTTSALFKKFGGKSSAGMQSLNARLPRRRKGVRPSMLASIHKIKSDLRF